MGAEIILADRDLLHVEPGAETSCEVRVVNSGEIVDQFTLQVVGDCREWASVEPAVVNLLPGDEAAARVTFRPPRSSEVLAGRMPFGVRAGSREDPHASAVDEGELEVAPFTDLVAELVPPIRRGRRRARYRLVVDNNGNHDQPIDILAVDPEDNVAIVVAETSHRTQPGTATIITTKVAPHQRFWRGEPRTHPFQLLVQPVAEEAEADSVVTVDGVMIQERLVPAWLLRSALVAIAAVVALTALWFGLLKPTVESVAKEQAAGAASRANQAADRADAAAEDASAAAQGGGAAPTSTAGAGAPNGEAGGGPSGSAAPTAAPRPTGSVQTPTSFRIESSAPIVDNGSFQAFRYVAPEGQALEITDLVLQNPRGDSGFLRIALDDAVILEVGLANFRDLDYHYVVPLGLAPGEPLVFLVNCTAAGSGAERCTPSASFSGRLTKKVP